MAQQNLVLNPGFEDTLHLTPHQDYGAIYPLCKYWINPNGVTSDYFSIYADELEWQTTNVAFYRVGENVISNLPPHSGNGMVGSVLYENDSQTRDFCRGELSNALLSGNEYCIGLWVRRGENSGYTNCEMTIGFRSDSTVFSDNPGIIPLEHQVRIDISDVDSSAWKYKSVSYLATGGEKFLYIGNNEIELDTACIQVYDEFSELWNSSYVLIDDVEVKDSGACIVSTEQEGPYMEILDVNTMIFSLEYAQCNFVMYDCLGRIKFRGNQMELRVALEREGIPDNLFFIVASDGMKFTCLKYFKH